MSPAAIAVLSASLQCCPAPSSSNIDVIAQGIGTLGFATSSPRAPSAWLDTSRRRRGRQRSDHDAGWTTGYLQANESRDAMEEDFLGTFLGCVLSAFTAQI